MEEKIKIYINNHQIDLAFKLLVKEYNQKVYWQVRRMVLIHEDADDVTQNVFIKVFQHLNNFRNESKLSSWIYRIAYNESINFIQKRAKENHLTVDDYAFELTDKLEEDPYFEGDEAELKFQKAVQSLPEKQRIIFKMKYFDELKYEEISNLLNTSVGALKASYHHAVKKIEQFILNSD